MIEARLIQPRIAHFPAIIHLSLWTIPLEEQQMFNLGWPEVLIVLFVAVLIFGPKKFPEMGGTFGKTLRGFKDGLHDRQADPDPVERD
jgi:sec-independent protein translocase protein TatA